MGKVLAGIGVGLATLGVGCAESELTPKEHVQKAIEKANETCKATAESQLGGWVLDGELTVAENEEAINDDLAVGMVGCVADKTGLTEQYVSEQGLSLPVVAIINGQATLLDQES